MPLSTSLARRFRSVARHTRLAARAVRTFVNFPVYFLALTRAGVLRNPHRNFNREQKRRENSVLRTWDGLKVTIRDNYWDARIVREAFIEKPYLKYFSRSQSPVIIDIGAYIGDFSLYAAKYLNARVIAYEPTAENFAMLQENVRINNLEHRVEVVNKAVGLSGEISLGIEKNDQEIHVSRYLYPDGEQRTVQSVSLQEIFSTHGIEKVDLLKVDCEGGEYDIFPTAPDHLFARIQNIVFEHHPVEDYEKKIDDIIVKMTRLGYTVHRHGILVYATRN